MAMRSVGKNREWARGETGRQSRSSAFQRQIMSTRASWIDEYVRSRPCAESTHQGWKPRRGSVPQSVVGRSAGYGRQKHARDQTEVWPRGDGFFIHAQSLATAF